MGGYANNAPIVTDGLVFYVDAGNSKSYDGVSGGTTWTDLVGGNDGTLTNMETNPANAGYVYDSANGGSIVFDGINDYTATGTANDFLPVNDMTVDAWIYLSKYDSCICMSPDPSGGNEMIFYIPSTTNSSWVAKKLSCTFDNSAGASGTWPTSSTDIPLSAWTHVCLVRDGATCRFYYNGVADGTGTMGTGTLSYATGQPLYIATDTDTTSWTTGNFFGGKMGPLKIYNRALSASEILQNYNALKNRFV